jgi:hypothetical protein
MTITTLSHETAEGPQDRAAWRQLLATAPRSTDSVGRATDPGLHRQRRPRDLRHGGLRHLADREGRGLMPSERRWIILAQMAGT